MSENFEKVSRYYKNDLWNIEKVWNAVGKWITEEEYKEITGLVYPNKEMQATKPGADS